MSKTFKTLKPANSTVNGGGVALKSLSVAVFAGCVTFGAPAFANNADYVKAPERIDNTLIADSVNNVVFENFTSKDFKAGGGAVYNAKPNADVNIIANFNNNSVSAFESDIARAEGGAIHNGTFTQGYAAEMIQQNINTSNQLNGLNKAENATLGNITGNFNNNSAKAVHDALGGAIFNTGKIENIKGNFTSNNVQSANAMGGAVANVYYKDSQLDQANQRPQDTLGLLSFDNETNEQAPQMIVQQTPTVAQIKSIVGEFSNNYIIGSETAQGGAIYNSGIISEIKGTYSKNNIQGKNAHGGAIYNSFSTASTGVLTMLESVSDEDYGIEPMMNIPHNIQQINSERALTSGIISNLNADFTGNTVIGLENAGGGAIYNSAKITNITGTFTENKVQGKDAVGGAIANSIAISTGKNITLLGSVSDEDYGIEPMEIIVQRPLGSNSNNVAQIANITADFIANSVQGETSALGGAIYNTGVIGLQNEENQGTVESTIRDTDTIEEMVEQPNDSMLSKNRSSGYRVNRAQDNLTGGIVNSSFIGNSAVSKDGVAQGGAIYTTTDLNIIAKDGYTVIFKGNYTESAGKRDDNAIYVGKVKDVAQQQPEFSGGLLTTVDASLSQVKTSEKLTQGYRVNRTGNGLVTLTFKMENGGKILMADNIDGDLGTTAKDEDSTIRDTDIGDEMVEYTNPNLLVQAASNQKSSSGYRINRAEQDDVNEEVNQNNAYGYNVNIVGDDINNTTFYMLNDIRNAAVTLANTTINTINNQTHVYDFGALRIGADTKMLVDVDLQNKEMDRFTAKSVYTETTVANNNDLDAGQGMLAQANKQNKDALSLMSYTLNRAVDDSAGLAPSDKLPITTVTSTSHNGNIIVSGMNLMSDAKEDKTEILFAQKDLKDNVKSEVTAVYSPIYSYSVKYDNREDGGYFQFIRGGSNGGGVSGFNPAVVAAPVAAQAGATATMNQTFNYAFQNSDNFMVIPYLERVAMKNKNKYALSPTGDATDMGNYSPLLTKTDSSSVWVKPYASFENIPLKNGPKVSNITYGTLVGYDTDLVPMKNGWDRVWTGYIGYNGASQRYSGVDSTQSGGLLGGTLTLYKGNFFNATTISAGANVANNKTMYGSEDFTMLLAGIGNKTGYNFEFKEGKVIIQPSMLLSYTFVNTFDYTNAAGVKINSKPLNAIQLAPGVKIIGNTKNGWQPYVGVNMVWNILDKSDVTANGVKLPEMSIKPYVQYGIGVQKRFKDRCMAFGQAMIQSGGRNGISLTAGFRWALGKDSTEKVKAPDRKKIGLSEVYKAKQSADSESLTSQTRTILKELTQQQKTALGKLHNSTKTTYSATVKSF